jgi:hypothetical protein
MYYSPRLRRPVGEHLTLAYTTPVMGGVPSQEVAQHMVSRFGTELAKRLMGYKKHPVEDPNPRDPYTRLFKIDGVLMSTEELSQALDEAFWNGDNSVPTKRDR